MKSLVVSGGGSKGAYAGGICQYLKESGKDWDFYAGTSTGSLIVPMVACNDIENLKKAYTNITADKIFTINPFKIKSTKNGNIKFGIHHFNIARNLILNHGKSLGDSTQLRTTIEEFLSPADYDIIRSSGKDVIVSVCNLSLETIEFKSILEESHTDFMDWMWASGSAAPFMSIVNKNGYDYADGGLFRFIPLLEAIERGATEIDAIILMEEKNPPQIEKIGNVLQLLNKIIKLLLLERKRTDTDMTKLHKSIEGDLEVKLNLYYTPRRMTNNPYIFDTKTMNGWWEEGYQDAHNGPTREFILTRKKVIKVK